MHACTQSINPLPYPFTAINCLGWVIYGAVIQDPFIPPANIIGLIGGVFFTMSVLPFCQPAVSKAWLMCIHVCCVPVKSDGDGDCTGSLSLCLRAPNPQPPTPNLFSPPLITSSQMCDILQGMFMLTAFTFGLLSMITTHALDPSTGQAKTLWGLTCVGVLMIYCRSLPASLPPPDHSFPRSFPSRSLIP